MFIIKVFYLLQCSTYRNWKMSDASIWMSHWRHTMVDGAKFWISCKRLKLLRRANLITDSKFSAIYHCVVSMWHLNWSKKMPAQSKNIGMLQNHFGSTEEPEFRKNYLCKLYIQLFNLIFSMDSDIKMLQNVCT